MIAVIIVVFSTVLAHFYVGYRYDITLSEYFVYNQIISNQERALLTEQPLQFGVYDYPPLSYTNKYNNLNVGIIVDYLSQVAIEFGHDIVLKVADVTDIENTFATTAIDALAVDKRALQDTELPHTNVLFKLKGKILVRESQSFYTLDALSGQSLVAIKRHHVGDLIDEQRFAALNISIVEVDNMYQCFALLRNGTAVGYLGDDMEALHYLNVTNKGSFYRFLDDNFYVKEIVFAVNPARQYLVDILNKAILSLKKKNLITQTQYKWLGEARGVDPRQMALIYKLALAAVVVIGIFSVWNYLITKKVNEKTRQLRESKEELRLIIDTMHSGIIVLDNNGLVLDCNNLIADILGLKRAQLLLKDSRVLTAMAPFIDANNHNRLIKVGNAYYYSTAFSIAQNKKMIIVEDYTEKYLKERRARQQSKMIAIGQLSAGLAHEIRNPLGLIKSYSYLLDKSGEQNLKAHAMQVIDESVLRINTLIDNLLRYSKLTNEIHKQIDLTALIDMIVSLEKKHLEQNDIVLSVDVGQQKPQIINANEDLLKLIFINLINNSIDSFQNVDRAEKRITITVRLKNGNLLLTFKDNGCGIDAEALENVFNPFYSTKEKGSGLGLYIINTEVGNADGTIYVKSELDVGTEFEVTLPVKEGEKNDD